MSGLCYQLRGNKTDALLCSEGITESDLWRAMVSRPGTAVISVMTWFHQPVPDPDDPFNQLQPEPLTQQQSAEKLVEVIGCCQHMKVELPLCR